MTGLGTILNVACILIGGFAGLFLFRNISVRTQQNLKFAIAPVSYTHLTLPTSDLE